MSKYPYVYCITLLLTSDLSQKKTTRHGLLFAGAVESTCDGFCKMSVDYGLFFTHKYKIQDRNQGRFGPRSFRRGHFGLSRFG